MIDKNINERYKKLPNYLFFEEGDYVIWHNRPGVISRFFGDRKVYINSFDVLNQHFVYRAILDGGTMINDYCYNFKLDKLKQRNYKIGNILR